MLILIFNIINTRNIIGKIYYIVLIIKLNFYNTISLVLFILNYYYLYNLYYLLLSSYFILLNLIV